MCSYHLSKLLEPDDVPSSLYVPEQSLSSLSPARIRRALRHVFNTKGNIVGDSSPPSPPQQPSRNRLVPSLSERELSSTIDGPEDNDRTHNMAPNTLVICTDDKKFERSTSASPEFGRDRKSHSPETSSPSGHVVRVAAVNHDHCNYISLLVRSSKFKT